MAHKLADTLRDAVRGIRKATGFEDFYREHVRRHTRPDPRADGILASKPFPGRVKRRLNPRVEEKIKRRLDDAFAGGETVPAGIGDLKAPETSRVPGKALVAMQRYINGDPAQIDSDFFFHFTRSTGAAGLGTSFFDTGDCTYQIRDDARAERGLNALESAILTDRPDLVVFDGNHVGSAKGVNCEWWARTKAKGRFKLVTIIGDSYPPHEDYLGYWAGVSDLCVVFHRRNPYAQKLGDPGKILFAPGLPFAEGALDEAAPGGKDISFCCIGSNTRNRSEFCSKLRKTELPAHIRLHTRSRTEALSIPDYIKTLCRSKTVFNTGYVNETMRIVTFRAIEAILCKALLLEEDGAALSDYFTPWRHFIPVTNAHEVAIYAQFFSRNEDYRSRIVEAAFSMHQTHYSSLAFWRAVLNKVNHDAGTAVLQEMNR